MSASDRGGVKLGVTMFVTDHSMGPAELAREAEVRGFDSLYVPEHTHIPVGRRTPAPMGEPLPEEYRRTLDPFVALAAAATATTQLRIGTGICLVAQRDPIVTAKAVASLQLISAGRFVFGVGFGWNADELEDHGVSMRDRREVVRERVLTMQALWGSGESGYEGRHARVSPSWAFPKPSPRPPLLLGGRATPTLFEHIVAYADGWMPIGGAGVRDSLDALRKAAETAGRDPSTLRVVPLGSTPTPEKLEYFASIGIDELVCNLTSAGSAEVMHELDTYAELVPIAHAILPA